jgi:large subunit ribosomal protein L13
MKLNKRNITFLPEKSGIEKRWWLVDASDIVLGRLATKVADVLRGKDHPYYTPFFDCGDFVVIINARKVRVTGNNKPTDKTYFRYSGYRGGLRETSLQRMMVSHPERVVMAAVKGMLPKNRLNNRIITKLKVYADADHQHVAQKPELLKI